VEIPARDRDVNGPPNARTLQRSPSETPSPPILFRRCQLPPGERFSVYACLTYDSVGSASAPAAWIERTVRPATTAPREGSGDGSVNFDLRQRWR
jgi:hypothetical protein